MQAYFKGALMMQKPKFLSKSFSLKIRFIYIHLLRIILEKVSLFKTIFILKQFLHLFKYFTFISEPTILSLNGKLKVKELKISIISFMKNIYIVEIMLIFPENK